MAASIEYKASVSRDLRKLGHAVAVRVLLKVERMLASKGHQGEALSGALTGLYKLRVGDYRVIYARTEAGFLVLRIGHREDVYRKGRPEVNERAIRGQDCSSSIYWSAWRDRGAAHAFRLTGGHQARPYTSPRTNSGRTKIELVSGEYICSVSHNRRRFLLDRERERHYKFRAISGSFRI